MNKIITPFIGAIRDIIIDGDDTLWECALYYSAATRVCFRLIQMQFPDITEDSLRANSRQIQRNLITKYGYYAELFEDAWVENYTQLCHRRNQPVSETIAGALFKAAAGVHDAPYMVFHGVPESLAELKAQGYHLHLLTLGDNDWQRSKVQRNGLGGYFTSIHVIQRTKGPQMRLLARDPKRTLMVGDSEHSDIEPAVALGIEAAIIQSDDLWSRSHKPLPDHVHRISSFTKTPALLRRLASQS